MVLLIPHTSLFGSSIYFVIKSKVCSVFLSLLCIPECRNPAKAIETHSPKAFTDAFLLSMSPFRISIARFPNLADGVFLFVTYIMFKGRDYFRFIFTSHTSQNIVSNGMNISILPSPLRKSATQSQSLWA